MTGMDSSHDDSDLNRLIRHAGQGETPGFVRPGDDAIEAYLLGKAGTADRARVLAAMDASESFRLEIAAMARDLETLESMPRSEPTTAAEEPPDLREFAGAWESSHRMPFLGSQFLKALAALLLLAFGASQLARIGAFDSKPDKAVEARAWNLVTSHVDAGLLMDNRPRGSGVRRPDSFDTPLEAALDNFRNRLAARAGRFLLRDRHQVSLSEGSPGPELGLVTPNGASAGRLGVELPRGETAISPSATLWALALPSRTLYRIDMKGEIQSLVTPEQGSEFTIYALVTPVNDLFVATTVNELPK